MTQLFEKLSERGFVYQTTHDEQIRNLLNSDKKFTFYLGIDPTADSLHIGHFFALMMFRHLQNAGHRGILVIGGATAQVGDPSFKTNLRQALSKEQVEHNLNEVKTLVKKFIKTDGDNPAIILNNADWIGKLSYIDFLTIIGRNFNIAKMLSSEIYKGRLTEGGLTFLELGYMPMQAYDFVYLNQTYDCVLEIGGSDQWANITAGSELHRKMGLKGEIYGLTSPLLMTKEGKKMGKTEKGTLWVAGDKTTPFDFYQYFYNTEDESCEMLLKLFTEIPTGEIEQMCQTDILSAKKTMAFEITKLVHGEDAANDVLTAVQALFAGGCDMDKVPTIDFKIDLNPCVLDILAGTGFLASKGEARRMIVQGAITVDDVKITDPNMIIDLPKDRDYILLKKGKKNFLKVIFK